MRLRYRAETDSLSVVPAEVPEVEEPLPAIVLDFDDEGHLVTLDLQHAATWSISRGPGPRSFRISLLPPATPDEPEPAAPDG
ncbi:MAG TPA: DUF2283 domain-containing protein [Thermomicrobiaceae bacterium]|nr:DUF2283 domain-containing protein [Thermomicrobiaceae bacterium]